MMNKVLQIRSALGIRQAELAELPGICRSAFFMVERDERKLNAAAVLKLANWN